MDTQPDHKQRTERTDVVDHLELRADMCWCNGDPFCKACDDRHLAIAEIQRLRDTITNLRTTANRALWDTRNVANRLINAYARWHRPRYSVVTQPEAQTEAIAAYDADKATWVATDDIVSPPGWQMRKP